MTDGKFLSDSGILKHSMGEAGEQPKNSKTAVFVNSLERCSSTIH